MKENLSSIRVRYITSQSFPYGAAEVNKLILTCKSLILVDIFDVLILLRFSSVEKDKINMGSDGVFDGVSYKFLTGISYRPNSFIIRNLFKIKSFFYEISYLYETHILILNCKNILDLVYYKLISKILNFKIICVYHELDSAIPKRNLLKKINDLLFENFSPLFTDAALPISHYLKKKYGFNDFNSYVLPSLVDLEEFRSNNKPNYLGRYFMYCGSASYFEAINQIIICFKDLNCNENLLIVTKGKKDEINRIKYLINSYDLNEKIILKSNIKYENLISLYKNSLCNLMPLSNSERDFARFPHKIGEYCASKRPFITNKTDDILFYFDDEKNVLICNDFSNSEFTKKMKFVIDNSEERLAEIGNHSFLVAKELFDYKSHEDGLKKFILKVNGHD